MIPRNNCDSSLPNTWEYSTEEAFHRKEFLQHFSVAFISPALLWPNSISHSKNKPLCLPSPPPRPKCTLNLLHDNTQFLHIPCVSLQRKCQEEKEEFNIAEASIS